MRWYLNRIGSLDSRALSLMRIGIAVLIIVDLSIRIGDLRAFYTEEGIVPLSFLFNGHFSNNYFSFHNISSGYIFQIVLFLIFYILAFLLLVGYQTKCVTLCVFIMLTSLNHRNPYILQGGDYYLQLALFWAIFLPWNSHYSLDSKLFLSNKIKPKVVSSTASWGLILLIFSLYFFSALEKTSPEWRTEGTALYYALSVDQLLLPLGKLIYPYPNFLKLLTHFTFYLELLGPIFLLVPIFTNRIRLIFVLVFFGLHLGIGITLFVGLFWAICMVVLIGLLPPFVMDKLDKYFFAIGKAFRIDSGNWMNLFKKFGIIKYIGSTNNRVFKLVKNYFLMFCLMISIYWNYGNNYQVPVHLTSTLRPFAEVLGLEQHWGMFAPAVFKDDGWFIYEGTTNDSMTIDCSTRKTVNYVKPKYVVSQFKNDRWRKYTEYFIQVSNIPMRNYYCQYYLNKFNSDNKESKLKYLEIIYMKEVSAPNYLPVKATREVLCNCSN